VTRDPLDDLGPGDAGLMELFNHLTSEPSADELAGEYAALTMFRAAHAAVRAAPRRRARRRLVSRARAGARLVAAGTVAAMVGGFAAAGYAEALPSSLQHFAHQWLGFAGIPNAPGRSGSGKPTVPGATRRTTHPGWSRSAQPGSSGAASPSRHRSPSPSPSGTVVPTIKVSELPGGRGKSEMLIVSIPLAQRGDVVQLQDLVRGQWRLVRIHRLHRGGQTEFSVVARKISVTYRVVLPATAEHNRSVSGHITVAALPKKGGQRRG
jgi:hypothetical protein